MKQFNVHPFPARMASEIALGRISALAPRSTVLDPMAGSGTVLRVAAENGHRGIGFDLDPLAVMMSKVSTTKIRQDRLIMLGRQLLDKSHKLKMSDITLGWVDNETRDFMEYWFAAPQRRALTKIAYILSQSSTFKDGSIECDALRVALSRLIITKDRGASLARDVSHSRPHRVTDKTDFDVFEQFPLSVSQLTRRVANFKGPSARVRLGDARLLDSIKDGSVDMVLTSPPYLNAIDYMRGHRLSLVWLGYNLSQLRRIRSSSIGAERGLDGKIIQQIDQVQQSLGRVHLLPSRHQRMVERYSYDLLQVMQQTKRVMKQSGEATFVVGNSRLKGVFISNSQGLTKAADICGLKLVDVSVRKLPNSHRYLPPPKESDSALGRRMRTETVLIFKHGRKRTS